MASSGRHDLVRSQHAAASNVTRLHSLRDEAVTLSDPVPAVNTRTRFALAVTCAVLRAEMCQRCTAATPSVLLLLSVSSERVLAACLRAVLAGWLRVPASLDSQALFLESLSATSKQGNTGSS